MIEKIELKSGGLNCGMALLAIEGGVVGTVVVTDGHNGAFDGLPIGALGNCMTIVHPRDVTEIRQNGYFGGPVQSLGCHDLNGQRLTVGIILPRPEPYDFGTAEHEEHIKVRSGELIINGTHAELGDDPVIVPAGQQIVIACTEGAATYICYYH